MAVGGQTAKGVCKMYAVYTKHRSYKRASSVGIHTDDLNKAIDIANRKKNSWWGVNGIYEWVKVKDTNTNKYVYEA